MATTANTIRLAAVISIVSIVSLGTLYSSIYDTALDTSDPLISNLKRIDTTSYFAKKSNILNVFFVKKAWGWTSAAFFAVFITSPAELRKGNRFVRWVVGTLVWAAFTSWFFGPPLFDRFISASGGKCVIHLPSEFAGTDARSKFLVVPDEYCLNRGPVSPSTHPTLFTDPTIIHALSSAAGAVLKADFATIPRLYSGHDISGHIFLLTLSTLFLVDQIAPSLPLIFTSLGTSRPNVTATPLHVNTIRGALALVAIWLWMTFTTTVYFHTPSEKISGLGELFFYRYLYASC